MCNIKDSTTRGDSLTVLILLISFEIIDLGFSPAYDEILFTHFLDVQKRKFSLISIQITLI